MKRKLKEFQANSDKLKDEMFTKVVNKLEESGLLNHNTESVYSFIEYNYILLKEKIDILSSSELQDFYLDFVGWQGLNESLVNFLKEAEEVEELPKDQIADTLAQISSNLTESMPLLVKVNNTYIKDENLRQSLKDLTLSLSNSLQKATKLIDYVTIGVRNK